MARTLARRKARKTVAEEQRFPPASVAETGIGRGQGTFFAATRDDNQSSVGLNLDYEPVLFYIVPIAFAVLLRMHGFGARTGMGTVLGRGIDHAIAGSVHASCLKCAGQKYRSLCLYYSCWQNGQYELAASLI